jgi:hypothetical protein
MIFHVVTAIAVLADQAKSTQCLVQCVQAAQEPGWKWWLSSLAPWVGPLLSGIVSIYVAWRVFHWQGEKDRQQWIRDQKKAEWKDLLEKTAQVDGVFQRAESPNKCKSMKIIMEELPTARLELRKCWSRCLFIADIIKTGENKETYLAFDQKLDSGERSIRGSDIAQIATVPLTVPLSENYIGNNALFEQSFATYKDLKAANDSFGSWMLSVALQDLVGIKKS